MFGIQKNESVLSDYIKAGSAGCSPALLRDLAYSSNDRIRLRVAEHPRTPVGTLALLAADACPDVRVAVGTNPSTPAYVSYRLAFDSDVNVRLGLADDTGTPVELLDRLAEDANPYVSCRATQTKDLVMSYGKPRSLGRRFVRCLTGDIDKLNVRYA